jgi:hypothetical protein
MTVVSDNALSDLFTTIIIMIICVPDYYFSIYIYKTTKGVAFRVGV